MNTLETQWTLGVLIGLPAVILILAGLITGIVWAKRVGDAAEFVVMCSAAMIVTLLIAAVAFFPYKAEYHQWRSVDGAVTAINKRLISQDKGMAERYVFTVNGHPYGVDDTRAATVKVGDTVNLMCVREWQYASVSGYVCRWNQP